MYFKYQIISYTFDFSEISDYGDKFTMKILLFSNNFARLVSRICKTVFIIHMTERYKFVDEILRDFVETSDLEKEQKPVGLLFRFARKELGLSQKELAEKISVKVNSISKYEKAGTPGGQYPPMTVLAKLVSTLKLDPRIVLTMAADNHADRMQLLGPSLDPVAKSMEDFRELINEAIPHLPELFRVITGSFEDTGLAKQIGRNFETELLERMSPEEDLPSPPSSDPQPTPGYDKERDNGQP